MSTKTDRATVDEHIRKYVRGPRTSELLLALLARAEAAEAKNTGMREELDKAHATTKEWMEAEYRQRVLTKAAEAARDANKVDAKRMDWLQKEFEAHGCLKFERYSVGKAGCELFTVSSQHVRGYEIRGAIDAAMLVATHEAGK